MPEKMWTDLQRPTPTWFSRAKLGIFIHWGAYSVPAWAEPTGALGLVDDDVWYAHNPYAEWYANTIRLDGSPAREHHRAVHGDAPYDDFLDQWRPTAFDAGEWMDLFARAGADYVIPTAKHHDGIALWDAPGTGTRNTVHRGPRADLLAPLAAAARERALRFGVYYSGGLDWSVSDLPPIRSTAELATVRPVDEEYNAYALEHLRDLVARYRPDVLWGDIDWPDAGKRRGAGSLHEFFAEYYAGTPEGVVNDRWGAGVHHDFTTSEYSAFAEKESGVWENNRGLGFSYAYNRAEDASVTLSAGALAKLWVDKVARGGRLLINVGPRADGTIPELQRAALEGFGAWREAVVGDAAALVEASPQPDDGDGWTRVWATPDEYLVFTDEDAAGPSVTRVPR